MIGVLALQGNFDSHIKILKKINLKHKLVKTSNDLISINGLIIPGGESTTMTNLCLLYTSPSPRDTIRSRMPSSA